VSYITALRLQRRVLFCSFLIWFIRSLIPQDRLRFVRNHLRRGVRYSSQSSGPGNDGPDAERREAVKSERMVRQFTANYLRHDGVFLLRLIAHNTNGITTTEIARELWDLYYDRQTPHMQTNKGIEADENELTALHEHRSID